MAIDTSVDETHGTNFHDQAVQPLGKMPVQEKLDIALLASDQALR
jgi:hypothetical protein